MLPELSPDISQFIQSSWPLLLMAVIFYFLLWRPQKKEQSKRATFLGGLKRNDKIVTIGGMHGVITSLTDKVVKIRIAENVEVEVARTAVNHYQNPLDGDAKK